MVHPPAGPATTGEGALLTVTVIGGPTTLLERGELRPLADPTLDPLARTSRVPGHVQRIHGVTLPGDEP